MPFRDLVDELLVLLREDAEALGCVRRDRARAHHRRRAAPAPTGRWPATRSCCADGASAMTRSTASSTTSSPRPSPALLERGGHAAVDGELGAGDVGGLVAGEEQRRLGDLLGRAEAAQRRRLEQRLLDAGVA